VAQDGTQNRSKVVFKMLVMAELKLFKFLTLYSTFVLLGGAQDGSKGHSKFVFLLGAVRLSGPHTDPTHPATEFCRGVGRTPAGPHFLGGPTPFIILRARPERDPGKTPPRPRHHPVWRSLWGGGGRGAPHRFCSQHGAIWGPKMVQNCDQHVTAKFPR